MAGSGTAHLRDGADPLLSVRNLVMEYVTPRREKVFAYRYEGVRYDCGSKDGFLEANVELALAHPQLGPGFRDYLRGLEL